MKTTVGHLVTLILISMLGYVACGPIAPATLVAGETKTVEGSPQKSQPDDWQKVVAEAKKESDLLVYWGAAPEVHQRIAREFKQNYGITVGVWGGASSMEQVERMTREAQAGINNVDVLITGHNAVLLLRSQGLIRPLNDIIMLLEVLDGSKWVQGNLPYWAGDYEVGFGGAVNSGIWRNTDLVQEAEIKEYGDLLKPQYKGKIVSGDPSVNGPGTIWFRNYYPVLGESFMKALVKQEPLVSRDRRLTVEWLARGKYPILVAGTIEELLSLKKLGLPIKGVETKEGEYIHTGNNSIAVATRAPHPNAARVFVNWMLTKEGQTLWSEAISVPSFRVDVPTVHLDPAAIPKRGKAYFADTPETYAKSGEFLALGKQIFAPVLK